MNEWEVISWIITHIQKKYVISNAFCTRKYKQSDCLKISEIIITKMTNWCLRSKASLIYLKQDKMDQIKN